jgi:hypothetical protein
VEHPDHLDPLGVLKMKQNVLAYDQAEAVPYGTQRKEIVLLKLDSASQKLGYPEAPGFFIRLKVFVQQLPGHPFDFIFLIDPGAYDVPKEAAIVQVRRVNSEVLESEGPHVFGKQHGQ